MVQRLTGRDSVGCDQTSFACVPLDFIHHCLTPHVWIGRNTRLELLSYTARESNGLPLHRSNALTTFVSFQLCNCAPTALGWAVELFGGGEVYKTCKYNIFRQS